MFMNDGSVRIPAKEKIILAILLLVIVVTGIWYGNKKDGLILDEVYTYGFANSNYLAYLERGDEGYTQESFMLEYGAGNNVIDLVKNLWKDMGILIDAKFELKATPIYQAYLDMKQTQIDNQKTSWLSGQYFADYLAVEEGTGFNYGSVYMNQRADVHPPLYYILLHTVSSFFEGIFSKWFAFGINLIILLATLLVIYVMVRRSFKSGFLALATVAVYGLSTGFFSSLIFFRMYALLTLWTVLLCYFHLYMKEKNWEFTRKRKFALIAIVVLGYYTQYYFIIYAFFMALVASAILARRKNYKVLWCYIRQYLYAAVIGLIIWPFSISHIFFGYRGTRATETMKNIKGLLGNIHATLVSMNKSNFAESTVYLYVALIIGIVTFLVFTFLIKKDKEKRDLAKYGILFLPVLLYVIAMAWVNDVHVERYVLNIFPLVSVYLVALIWFWSKKLKEKASLCAAIVLAFIVVAGSPLLTSPNYLTDLATIPEDVPENVTCVYVMGDGNICEHTKDAPALSQYDRVAILHVRDLEFLKSYEYQDGDSVMIYLSWALDQDAVIETIIDYMDIEHLSMQYSVIDTGYYLKRLYQ